MQRFRAVAAAFFSIALLAQGAAAHEDATVQTRRVGDAVEVSVSATLRAPLDVAWATLTDYNQLPKFIPGILRSHLVEYRGHAAIVEQRGEARFLLLSFPIDVTLASVESPPHAIDVHVLKGNLRKLDGGYRIEPRADGWLTLRWRGLIEPGEPLPPLIGEFLMRMSVANQFFGMVDEIERRAAIAVPRAKRAQ